MSPASLHGASTTNPYQVTFMLKAGGPVIWYLACISSYLSKAQASLDQIIAVILQTESVVYFMSLEAQAETLDF